VLKEKEMETISPLMGLAGGVLIGAAAAVLLLLSGRIAGVSGMLASAVRIADQGAPWKQAAAFIVGLPLGAWLVTMTLRAPDIAITSSVPTLILAGLLVGFGTRMGNGCTSGHGVCGIARVSRRSIVATAVFMATGITTVLLIRHVFGG
jgi:uncharacterized membrane protein YedE/YeeE